MITVFAFLPGECDSVCFPLRRGEENKLFLLSMASVKEINGRLNNQPFLCGYTPSKEDANAFNDLFGDNAAVIQWMARMASYYQKERDSLLHGDAPKATAPAAAATSSAPKAQAAPAKAEEDIDLFGEETEEDKAALASKKAADAEKKKAKPAAVAKSSIVMDIKPWDDETNLKEFVEKLKAVQKDVSRLGSAQVCPRCLRHPEASSDDHH